MPCFLGLLFAEAPSQPCTHVYISPQRMECECEWSERQLVGRNLGDGSVFAAGRPCSVAPAPLGGWGSVPWRCSGHNGGQWSVAEKTGSEGLVDSHAHPLTLPVNGVERAPPPGRMALQCMPHLQPPPPPHPLAQVRPVEVPWPLIPSFFLTTLFVVPPPPLVQATPGVDSVNFCFGLIWAVHFSIRSAACHVCCLMPWF